MTAQGRSRNLGHIHLKLSSGRRGLSARWARGKSVCQTLVSSDLFCLCAFATALLLQSGPAFSEEKSQPVPLAESAAAPEDYFADLIVEDTDRNSRTDRNKFSVIRLAGGNSLVRFTIRDKVYEELRNEAGMTMHTRIVDRASRELLQITFESGSYGRSIRDCLGICNLLASRYWPGGCRCRPDGNVRGYCRAGVADDFVTAERAEHPMA